MHGRVKVRTTAEQEAAKREKRAKELAQYAKLRGAVFSMRAKKQHDETALSLTGEILSRNPDFYTVFNFRRHVLEALLDSADTERNVALCNGELSFVVTCLKRNPKSYGAWFQREWIMKRHAQPAWEEELELCSKYLQLDERNFHCWDYRRFVAAHAGADVASADSELAFTEEKVTNNFSNYSAWHYRSNLLDVDSLAEDDPRLNQEFDLVRNSLYIDPQDQSGWLYLRRLLGHATPSAIPVFGVVFNNSLFMAFSGPVHMKQVTIGAIGQEEPFEIDRARLSATSSDYQTTEHRSCAWKIDLSDLPAGVDSVQHVTYIGDDGAQQEWSGQASMKAGQCCFANDPDEETFPRTTIARTTRLDEEIECAKDLLEAIDEPAEEKWPLLTLTDLLLSKDWIQNAVEALRNFDRLAEVDATRRNYYLHRRTRLCTEMNLSRLEASAGQKAQAGPCARMPVGPEVDFSGLGLTWLCRPERLLCVTTLNLDDNALTSLSGLEAVPALQHLSARRNKIKNISSSFFQEPGPKTLLLDDNGVEEPEDIKALLAAQNWNRISLTGNPVCQLETMTQLAAQYPCLVLAD